MLILSEMWSSIDAFSSLTQYCTFELDHLLPQVSPTCGRQGLLRRKADGRAAVNEPQLWPERGTPGVLLSPVALSGLGINY